MKKISYIILLILFCFYICFSGCKKVTSNNKEKFESKWIDGIDALFDESIGYTNEHPSVIQVGNKRYIYYTRNTIKNDFSTESIAVREGNYKNGKWNYGDFNTCITVSNGLWDSGHVFNADVVKGEFKYNNIDYEYLMAYSGTKLTTRKDSSIGFAIAKNPIGPWIKIGKTPIISFDSREWDSTALLQYNGDIEPSLVNFDKKGKIFLFYEEVESFKSNYVIEMDASNLNDIKKYSKKVIETTGVKDMGISNSPLYGADFVWDKDAKEFIVIRECTVTASIEPKISDEIEIVKSSEDVLSVIKQDWTGREESADIWWSRIGNKIDVDNTSNGEDKVGYSRIFSPCILTDEFGSLLEYGKLELFFTSQAIMTDERAVDDNMYRFTGMIHTLTITY